MLLNKIGTKKAATVSDVTLIRPKELSNKYVSYPIFVNGEHITNLDNNSQQTITVDDNCIEIEAKIKWCGSPTKSYTLKDRKNIKLEVAGNKFYNLFVPVSGSLLPGLLAIHFWMPSTPTLDYGLMTAALLIFVYLLYTLTLDRTSWIEIKEI